MDPVNNCKGKMNFQKSGYLCWNYDKSQFDDGPLEFFKSLPILRFMFDTEKDATGKSQLYAYDWFPSEYLYMENDNHYCMAADIQD